ncbi:hypothetical protein CSC62_10090 [Pseudoxanthomonas jiangsuensis]|uniref:hypothetical protein n=1 Tax=Pseudoxanthomonas jiangsuensis TaxID=619688 RepID=UPI001390B4F7|nr:hypothetical protein [Pseudoxanthomonas jiangsuensis]KAF1695783.1 hypothetical protein CSC62_10090 [Pseudoxanthomonas jiangsuensis]
MNAIAERPRLSYPSLAPLRTILAAGGWANALILLGMGPGPLLVLIGLQPDTASNLGLMLSAVFTMFWAMLAGARLIALTVHAARLRLPHTGRQALLCGLAAAVLVVLVPALIMTMATGGGFALAAAALAAATALGLFWVSMPPWMMWVLIASGVAARWLPGSLDDATARAWLGSPLFIAALAALLFAASASCWWWIARRPRPQGTWSTPMALALPADGRGSLEQAQQANWNSPLFALDTPIGSALHREPQQALAIALGPGFGRGTLRNVLATQGPIVAVALFWLLLGNTTGGRGHIGLAFAPLMVLSTAFAPMIRLQTLFWRPALGLHELALLPGLPARPAPSLAAQLGRQAIVRSLPALAVMAGFGLAVDAPRGYYLMLMWTCAGSLFLMSGATLLSLRSRPGRWACAALVVALILGLMATMLATMRGDPPSWLHTAWSLVLIAGVLLQGAALARLRALPHPWLQN